MAFDNLNSAELRQGYQALTSWLIGEEDPSTLEVPTTLSDEVLRARIAEMAANVFDKGETLAEPTDATPRDRLIAALRKPAGERSQVEKDHIHGFIILAGLDPEDPASAADLATRLESGTTLDGTNQAIAAETAARVEAERVAAEAAATATEAGISANFGYQALGVENLEGFIRQYADPLQVRYLDGAATPDERLNIHGIRERMLADPAFAKEAVSYIIRKW